MAAKSSSPSTYTLPSIPPLVHVLSFLLLSSSFLPRSTSQSTSQEDEKRTLLKIKADWGNPSALSSWNNSAATHCNWTGILCDDGFVTEIFLSNQGLAEQIPPAMCDFKNLSYLDLSYNNLPGPFPTTLYKCSNLKYLDLSQNLFVGELPVDIDRLSPRLTYLSLSNNNFSGDIPASIARFPAIQSLCLDNNLFNGSLPAELSNLRTLETLTLAYNPFAPARIPPEFGNLTRLSFFWMTKMNLLGEIPESLGKLTELEQLDLAWNSLNGTIPRWIWKLEKLKYLYLYANKFSGEINGTIGALGLVKLDVSKNKLTGSIPEDIGKLKNLSVLFMYDNILSGEIPARIGLLPNLYDIRLFNNSLTGVLPPELGKHSGLWNIEVQWNRISGELPQHLCYRKILTSVNVFDNNFTGEVPASLGDCSTLDNIQLYRNGFYGDFPTGIWSAVNLTTVIIRENALSGTLPDELSWNLTRLELENNRFSGKIPSSAKNLLVFKARNNLFSGEISATLAGISRLQELSLGGNQISGSIPPAVSGLKSLTILDLRDNRLSGEIPATLGSLPSLTSLDLSGNQLFGAIPPAIGNLKLNFLNLSSNQLSGEIPTSLQNQAYELSFLANPGLCSSSNSIKNLHTCGYHSDGLDKLSVQFLVVVPLLGALLFLAVVAIGFKTVREHRRRRMDDDDLASWKLTSFHALDFTEHNVVQGLTESNSIGSGGSGKVYRIVVGNRAGEVVAVKKIWSSRTLDSKLEKAFQAEVEILGSIRHVNIVKLLCCISKDDSKLLVYEYLENESLDQWLHKAQRTDRGSGRSDPLDWPTRLRIAIGAARGLSYMHHDCSPPIVHRDVKSSNILLNSEFDAKIADFGLARMLVQAGEPDSVSAIAGTFGYMAPECGQVRKVNEKVDVFSFGVVLLELVTGRGANDGDEHGCLAEWAWRRYQEGSRVIDIIDEEIQNPRVYIDEMEVVFRLALFCTGKVPSGRPSMKEVLQVLIKCGQRLGPPNMLHREFDAAPLLQTKKGSRRGSASDTGEGEGRNYLAGVV
ncbi:receptor-like protein kinase HSL1 [Phoenix dactylifera]|uniref:Receptor-like protein kinase HSL1 n=1 Tax=Phoenix dactylifera TaxID=42345 RepID=A0A8B7C0K8_PHODC|nr:receptor-like protein kinase HSL1 [Phoenix dactylifera]